MGKRHGHRTHSPAINLMEIVSLLAVAFALFLAVCTLIGLYVAYRKLYRD
jgi:hypothetical protein